MASDNPDDFFEVLPMGEMRRKYYHPDERPPVITLSAEKVPEGLRALIPIAEKWGISDDILREDALQRASKEERDELTRIVTQYDDLLDAWLAGPETANPPFSAVYLAFSNMRMAAYGC
jgi:hypothetical protein